HLGTGDVSVGRRLTVLDDVELEHAGGLSTTDVVVRGKLGLFGDDADLPQHRSDVWNTEGAGQERIGRVGHRVVVEDHLHQKLRATVTESPEPLLHRVRRVYAGITSVDDRLKNREEARDLAVGGHRGEDVH